MQEGAWGPAADLEAARATTAAHERAKAHTGAKAMRLSWPSHLHGAGEWNSPQAWPSPTAQAAAQAHEALRPHQSGLGVTKHGTCRGPGRRPARRLHVEKARWRPYFWPRIRGRQAAPKSGSEKGSPNCRGTLFLGRIWGPPGGPRSGATKSMSGALVWHEPTSPKMAPPALNGSRSR